MVAMAGARRHRGAIARVPCVVAGQSVARVTKSAACVFTGGPGNAYRQCPSENTYP
jgi:hypothetical protein